MSVVVNALQASEKHSGLEVRCSVRFPLHLPIRVVTNHGEFEAVTENISASGVLFSLTEPLEVNSLLELHMRMPAEAFGTSRDVVVECTARVVRSYSEGQQTHAAAVIDDYRFS